MSGLAELYQQVILDEAKRRSGEGLNAERDADSHQFNPTCGDEIKLGVTLNDGEISTVSWEGDGCSISMASASLLHDLMADRPIDEAQKLISDFREVLRSRGKQHLDEEEFGDAAALDGVSHYIARVKCAMLAWVALEDALAKASLQSPNAD